MAQTIKLMFDGELKDCLVRTLPDGEILCETRQQEFIKFPAGCDLAAEAKKHNDANAAVPVFAHEVEARESEREAWLRGEEIEAEEIALESKGRRKLTKA